ncbi:MAG TPA: hypothetical protein VF369_03365 [candidate division Zixibacteria bacterium]
MYTAQEIAQWIQDGHHLPKICLEIKAPFLLVDEHGRVIAQPYSKGNVWTRVVLNEKNEMVRDIYLLARNGKSEDRELIGKTLTAAGDIEAILLLPYFDVEVSLAYYRSILDSYINPSHVLRLWETSTTQPLSPEYTFLLFLTACDSGGKQFFSMYKYYFCGLFHFLEIAQGSLMSYKLARMSGDPELSAKSKALLQMLIVSVFQQGKSYQMVIDDYIRRKIQEIEKK